MIKPEAGGVTFVSQSGGILVDHMIKFAQQGVGMAKAVSIGNKAFVREKELLAYLSHDPATKVIAYYIEGFGEGEGRAFVQAADVCAKPVVIMKSGKTAAGNRAVSSHTASLAGDYASFAAAVAQHNIIEAANENELVSFCEVLSSYTRPIEGRIGIITGSGGHGAMAVDACSLAGLAVPELSDRPKRKFKTGFPKAFGPLRRWATRRTSPAAPWMTTLLPAPGCWALRRKSTALWCCCCPTFRASAWTSASG